MARVVDVAVALMVLTAPALDTPARAASYPLAQARLTWEWHPGTTSGVDDAQPTGFKVLCGIATNTYTLTLDLPNPAARSAYVRDIVKTPGAYYCVVKAYNAAGDSDPSNEVFFSVAATLLPAGNLTVGK